MSALLWIGYAPENADGVEAPAHRCLGVPGGLALALQVDAKEGETEEGVLDWATRQNAVLSAYAMVGDVLPVPLGSLFSTEAALIAHVSEQAATIQAAASAISGHVEYTFHARATEQEPPRTQPPANGRAFLRQRGQNRRTRHALGNERRAALNQVSALFCDTAREVKRLKRQGPDRLLDLAMLIPRHKIAPLVERLRAEAETASIHSIAYRLVGPGPAYSFAMGEAELG